ncbi:collagen binding domain-containing protein, partial [Liquorilactobacillus ghanensis]|uniref:collagen binding domain-containing protein n=1 Tax=Liquorilactobacillus ghanensis TaxID=399370 RepID=UPI0039EA1833
IQGVFMKNYIDGGKKILLLRILSVLLILINIFLPAFHTSANQVSNRNFGTEFLTSASLLDKDGKAQDKFNIHDNMSANWTFNIPSGTSVAAGDTFEIPIPSQIALDSDVSFPVSDSSGATIGNAIADHNTQKIIVTLTNNAVSDNAVSGKINLSVNWNQSVVKTDQTNHIEWGFKSLANDYFVTGGTINPNELLTKGGYYDKTDNTKIHWDVRVNYAKFPIQNAVYTDILGASQTLDKGSVTAYIVNYNSDGSFSIVNKLPQSQIVYDSDTKFHLNLGNISDSILIRYSSIANDGGKSTNYFNSGLLTGDNITSQTSDVYTPNRGGGGTGDTTLSVSGQKTWNDQNNQDGIRPESIKVNLLANGTVIQTKTVTSANGWKYTFQDLPKYQDGKVINYTISEEAVKGYTSLVDGYNLTNSYTPILTPTPKNPGNPVGPNNGQIDYTPDNKKPNNNVFKTMKKSSEKMLPKTAAEKVGFSAVFAVVIAAITGGLIFKNRRNKP